MRHGPRSYTEIGKVLASKREELNITISSVSTDLKIRDVYLKAIEDGDIARIPSGIYRDGYIKSYAEFLNLNLDLDGGKSLSAEPLDIASRNVRPNLSSPNKLVLWLSITAVVLVNIFLYFIK